LRRNWHLTIAPLVFCDSDDNVDMNLEEMMVMEAIWRSIQVTAQELFPKNMYSR
jgi:hypothetical protein